MPASPTEALDPLVAVEHFLPAASSHPGPAYEGGEGVFQTVIACKQLHAVSPRRFSSDNGALGRNEVGTMEALEPSATVEPSPPAANSRPGPVCWSGDRVFQPPLNGKYTLALNNSTADAITDSSSSIDQQCSTSRGRLQSICSEPGAIWLYYQNVRGVRTKIDELFLASNDCDIDVIIFTETNLDDCINSLQLFGASYNVYRCDRNSTNSDKTSCGGVLIAVAQQYPSSKVEIRNGQKLEQVCVSSVIKKQKLLLMAVYIPPNRSRDISVINAHIASVQELCDKGSSNDMVLVCGDYNQPRISWMQGVDGVQIENSDTLPPSAAALADGFDFLNLTQVNYHLNYLGRALDLVYFSSEKHIDVSRAAAPLLPVDPYHPPLDISVPILRTQPTAPTRDTIRQLNYRRLDFEALTEYLSNVDWSVLLNLHDVDDITERFCFILRGWLNENLPTIRPPVKPPWSNPELRRLKRVRNTKQRLLRNQRSDDNQRAFKLASDAYRRLNAGLYKSHVMRVQFGLRRDPKSFWNFVNSKRKCSSVPSSVFLDGSESSSAEESCELFAKHFASVFSSHFTSQLEAEEAAANLPADVVDLDLFHVSPDMIITASRKLKSSYSPGPDGIPAVIFCRCAASLAVPLGYIFNKSFEQKKFPTAWKQSLMFPVFKKGDKRNVKNYRGITSLSAGSKLFEIIVGNVIHSCTKNYISFNQHGFMPGRSVTTNLLEFTNTCTTVIENRAQVDAVYTDLKAAFDVIDHRILLCKLSRLGASERLVMWMNSYLSGRILRVKLDAAVSSAFSNKSGVPQGSNLGPLLFALFFNDVIMLLGTNYVLVYADDLKIYLAIRCIEDCFMLQELLDTFANWCKLNKLVISIAKCVVITFHRSMNPITFDYKIDGTTLERVDQVSDLGVILDTKLSFTEHMSTIISKASRQLGFIMKISRDFTDPHCLKALYCALVRPILENAAVVWTPYLTSWDVRIERIQRRFIRIALRNLPWQNPHELPPYIERCRLLGLDSLRRRRRIQQATFVVKLLNGDIDAPALLSRIDFRAVGRQLRSSSLLPTRYHRTNYGVNEPLTSCVRTFSLVEDLFDFGQTSKIFTSRLTSSRLLQ